MNRHDLHRAYEKEISGCAIAGIMDESGRRLSGEVAINAIATMRERANGLGGGFAAYGIYPQLPGHYCFHVIYDDGQAVRVTEEFLEQSCRIEKKELIPHRHTTTVRKHPLLRRYFLLPRAGGRVTAGQNFEHLSDDDRILRVVMKVNAGIKGAFVFSSGRNMGIFKGVGYPEDIGKFYCLEEYKAYIWTAHGRFPTNTVGWWGGAHPFGILGWSVVHNGEISSYGINRRYLINFGYHCTLFTDTEVMTYLFDLLVRRHKLSLELVADILAAPFWEEIERQPEKQKGILTALRLTYGPALVNGPFSIIAANSDYMLGLTDRIKLRPLVAARKGNCLYLASEEAAIRTVCPTPERVWMPKAGEPVIGKLSRRKTARNRAAIEEKTRT